MTDGCTGLLLPIVQSLRQKEVIALCRVSRLVHLDVRSIDLVLERNPCSKVLQAVIFHFTFHLGTFHRQGHKGLNWELLACQGPALPLRAI